MKAIIFDLDGTLVDSKKDIAASVLAALEQLGRQSGITAEDLGERVGQPLTDLFLATDPSLDPGELERACGAYRQHYSKNCTVASRLYPGIQELLEGLRGQILLGCATTKRSDSALPVLSGLALLPLLDQWCGTDPPLRYKPEPDLLLAVAEELTLPPDELLYVGDTATDIQAAHAAGCRAAWVTWGYGERAACLAARPAHVLEAPAELLTLV